MNFDCNLYRRCFFCIYHFSIALAPPSVIIESVNKFSTLKYNVIHRYSRSLKKTMISSCTFRKMSAKIVASFEFSKIRQKKNKHKLVIFRNVRNADVNENKNVLKIHLSDRNVLMIKHENVLKMASDEKCTATKFHEKLYR